MSGLAIGGGRRLRQEVAALSPGYAAWVMSTAIVSTGLAQFHELAISDVLLVFACGAFALLLVGYSWRFVSYRARTLADARDPSRAFGYFTLVAAANVVAVRFALSHDPTAALVLGAASVPLWLLLTYGIPGAMVAGQREGPALPDVNGSWFLWVVATQSLSTTAATVAASNHSLTPAMVAIAVSLWGVGVILYLMLVGVVTIRLLELPVSRRALSSTYWIYMGATAITVLAGARILGLPQSLPLLDATRQVISGLAFLLWAFGSWWIPMLLAFALWRHVYHRDPLHYDAAWWSMVFPLGMYGVASASYGRATGVAFMVEIARVEVWVGLAAWLGVSVAMGASLLRPREMCRGSSSRA